MRILPVLLVSLGLTVSLSGCMVGSAVGAAVDVVTLPVKVVSKGVDMVTTSQSERDEKNGREARKQMEKLGRLQSEYDDKRRDCARGSKKACRQVDKIYREMRELMPSVPRGSQYPTY